MRLLTPRQQRLLTDFALHGECWTARTYGLSRRQIQNEIRTIREICKFFPDAHQNADHR